MKSQIVQTNKGPIEYTEMGEGSVVLVCHGTSCNCYSTGEAEFLAEAGYRVITPSRPGYGRTPLSVGKSAADAAEALIGLLDTLRIETCLVMGISGGGPTGLWLAARFPKRVTRLVLAAAISRPENRVNEPNYKNQNSFYGPMHNVMWGMLGLMSRISPQALARQTLVIFSKHDPDNGLRQLSSEDIDKICRFYRGKSSRQGALNDATHTVGVEQLKSIKQPTLVVHSPEDNSVPFAHAEWSLAHIKQAELCKAGSMGHFYWIGPDSKRISEQMIKFVGKN